jgi:hypothetical protein
LLALNHLASVDVAQRRVVRTRAMKVIRGSRRVPVVNPAARRPSAAIRHEIRVRLRDRLRGS